MHAHISTFKDSMSRKQCEEKYESHYGNLMLQKPITPIQPVFFTLRRSLQKKRHLGTAFQPTHVSPTLGHQVRPPATSVPSFVSLQLWRFLTPNVSSPQHLAAEDPPRNQCVGWVMVFVGVEILQNVFNIVMKSLRAFRCVVFFPLEEDKGKVIINWGKKTHGCQNWS